MMMSDYWCLRIRIVMMASVEQSAVRELAVGQ